VCRYVCPKCDPESKVNFVNFKQLSSQDYDTLKKLFKQIQVCKFIGSVFRNNKDKETHMKKRAFYDFRTFTQCKRSGSDRIRYMSFVGSESDPV
jgi:hypothetical protein